MALMLGILVVEVAAVVVRAPSSSAFIMHYIPYRGTLKHA